MRRIVLLLAAVVLLLSGCTDYRQIRIDGVTPGSFRFNGTSSATVELKVQVDNPTAHTVSVESVDAVLLREGREFVRFSLEDKVSAAPSTESTVSLPVRASVLDPVGIISAGLDFKSWRLEDFVVDGSVVLSLDGKMKKTVRLRKVPLKDIVNALK